MAILWTNFFVVYFSSFAARYYSHPLEKDPYVKPNKLWILLAMASLVIISGLRRNIGDTYFYMHSYKMVDIKLQDIKYNGDFGFNIFQYLLHHISNNPQILVFTTALITNVIIVLVLYQYSRMIELSLFIYIALGLFTVSMNGIRQALAASIIFAATKFIIEGKWKSFFLVVLLASTIHQTALIFLPVYWIVRRKAWTPVTFLLLLVAVGIAFEFNTFSRLLFAALQGTQYEHYRNVTRHGANVIRVAVLGAPLLMAYLGRDKLRKLWPQGDYIVNLSLIGFIFMVIATKNWLFARYDFDFGLYSLILISWIVQLFKGKERQFVYYGLIVCYFIYFYYEQVITLAIDYRSNFLHW